MRISRVRLEKIREDEEGSKSQWVEECTLLGQYGGGCVRNTRSERTQVPRVSLSGE